MHGDEHDSMNKLILVLLLAFTFVETAIARDTYVRGYVRRDGTYVQGHHRTTPDNSINNNYGTRGNINPYTNQEGTRPRRLNDNYGEYNSGNGLGTGSYGYGSYGSNDDEE